MVRHGQRIAKPRVAWRPLDGILLLDKPTGLSSNHALQRVRHLLRAEKGGHTGSLDPLATGLLPICLGEATKIAGHLLGGRKAYRTVARLGVETDTCDADGQAVANRPVPDLDRARLEALLPEWRGRIRQRPPIYSALKQGGEPLYAKARRGETVEVGEREVEIESLRLLDFGPDWLALEVVCGSGTYIRSLVRDMGSRLGCGAHVIELRRLWVEPFRQPQMIELDALAALPEAQRLACLLPLEAGLVGLPSLVLDAADAARLAHGQRLPGSAAHLAPGEAVAYDAEARAIGLVEIDPTGAVTPRRIFRQSAPTDHA